jgi:cell division protein FtsL
MKQVNILPKKEQKELALHFFGEQLVKFWVWVFISLFLFIALTYTAKVYLNAQVTDIDSRIAAEHQTLKSSDNEKLKQQVSDLNKHIDMIRNLDSQHYYWAPVLIELNRLMSTDMSFNAISFDRPSSKVVVQGLAGSRESVLKFWADMHKSDYFRDIDFPLENLNFATHDPFNFSFFLEPAKLKSP